MDLEFKAPSLESFYSPNHQQHSLSPIWTDKDKAEDDVDTAISDGDDQGSVQGVDIENSNDHACSNSLNDALEWENGVGSLAGSDLKFRMNGHGDIEVITTECLELDNDFPVTKDCNNRENLNRKTLETPNFAKTSKHSSDVFMGSENSPTTKEKFLLCSDESKLPDNNFVAPIAMNGETSPMLQEVEQQMNGEKEYNIENLAERVESPSLKKDEAVSPSLEDHLLEFDPVLSEDMTTMLYGNTTEEHKKDEIDHSETKLEYTEENFESFEKYESEILPLSSEKEAEPGKCIICGQPSTLGNRFCSRQCIGKNAAKQRKANHSSVNKKSKVERKKSISKRRHHEYCSPHPNDVLTVVHDESLGKRNDLKIKIRWSSSVSNENHDEDYSPEPRETSKRRAAAIIGNYSYAGCKKGARKRLFSWSSYILQENATAAPPEAFEEITRKSSFPTYNGFHIGMTLEGVDPEHEALICPLFVTEVRGCRIRLSFCGYSDLHDFWKDVDSRLIFPCGFCKETNRTLQPPEGYKGQDFDWEDYLKLYRLTKAPEELFTTKAVSSMDSAEKFAVGQKLEAVDKHNPGLVCVATIQDAIDSLVLIHFDGWSHNFDFWCSATSKHIHPIGWCQENRKELSPPLGYDESKNFSWDNYLAETSSAAADRRLFSNFATHRFEVEMKIEVVDPRNKILVRAASIIEIHDFNVKIHFDGWSDMYDFWTHLEDQDIHPVGWCEKTGHPLESPVSLDEDSENSWQASGCPIPGCSGIGHVHGAKFQNHYSEFGCPYSPQNLTKEHIKDRLSTHKRRRRTQAKEAGDSYVEEYGDNEFQDIVSSGRSTKASNCKRNRSFSNPPSPAPARKKTRGRPETTQENSYSNGLGDSSNNIDLVSKWSTNDVAKFVEEVTNEPLYGKIFSREEVDGRAILLMSQADILAVLKIKLGPAVKIYNAILTIKEM